MSSIFVSCEVWTMLELFMQKAVVYEVISLLVSETKNLLIVNL